MADDIQAVKQMAKSPYFVREDLLALARDRAGLDDFGDTWFFEPMDQFIASANREARLTEAGLGGQIETIVKGLVKIGRAHV